jgi:hypothetical protein
MKRMYGSGFGCRTGRASVALACCNKVDETTQVTGGYYDYESKNESISINKGGLAFGLRVLYHWLVPGLETSWLAKSCIQKSIIGRTSRVPHSIHVRRGEIYKMLPIFAYHNNTTG